MQQAAKLAAETTRMISWCRRIATIIGGPNCSAQVGGLYRLRGRLFDFSEAPRLRNPNVALAPTTASRSTAIAIYGGNNRSRPSRWSKEKAPAPEQAIATAATA